MKIDKLFKGLAQIANGDYVLEVDLICEDNLEVELDDRLVVKGRIEVEKNIIVSCGIKAGWGIEAGEGIEAGWGIEAGDGIKAGWGIKAGEGIEAKTFIHTEKRIFAGVSVYHTSENCKKTIKCAELRKGEVAFGDLIIKEQPVYMTIAEIEKALGIKNLKIKDDAE